MSSALFLLAIIFSQSVLAQSQSTQKIVIYGKRSPKLGQSSRTEMNVQSYSVSKGTIADAAVASPSVATQSTGGDTSVPEFLIRGQNSIENRYFVEGFPISNAQFNQPDLNALAPSFFSDLEIYPGGIPVIYGEDGLGGAINLGIKRGTNEIESKAGSFGAVTVAGDTTWLTGSVGLDYTQSNEDFLYFDDNGTPFNSSDDSFQRRSHNRMRRASIVPRFRLHQTKAHQLDFLSWHSYTDRQIPGPTFAPSAGEFQGYFQLTGLRSRAEVGGNVSTETHAFVRLKRDTLSDIPPYVGTDVQSFRTKTTALGVRSHWRFWDVPIDFVTGANWERYNITSLTTNDQSFQSRLQVPAGITSTLETSDKVFSITPAVQAHFYQFSSSGVSLFGTTGTVIGLRDSFILASPRVSAKLRPVTGLVLRAGVGQFYRAPNLLELYGSPLGVSPSSDLKQETAIKTEAGFDWAVDHGGWVGETKLSYTFGYSTANELINYIRNSQSTSVAVNVGRSRIVTNELLAQLNTKIGISLSTTVTQMSTTNLSDIAFQFGNDLPLRPHWRTQSRLSYQLGDWTLGYHLSWVSKSFADLSNSREISDVMTHNLSLSWHSKSVGSFLLEGRNLGNATTVASSYKNSNLETIDYSTGYPGYPAPGRRVYLSWLYQI